MKRGTARIAITAAVLLLFFALVYPSRSQTNDTPDLIGKLISAYPDFLTLIPPVDPVWRCNVEVVSKVICWRPITNLSSSLADT
jgi:hypothetical protein